VGHVARMGEENGYRREESEGLRPLVVIRRKLEIILKRILVMKW